MDPHFAQQKLLKNHFARGAMRKKNRAGISSTHVLFLVIVKKILAEAITHEKIF